MVMILIKTVRTYIFVIAQYILKAKHVYKNFGQKA